MNLKSIQKIVESVFGDYRDEWRVNEFDRLFVEPPYYHQLTRPRPVLLVGGRGTGKTVALKSLRFDLQDRDPTEAHYLAIYLRVHKIRVAAFQGSQFESSEWIRLFGHYFNLLISQQFCLLAKWLQANYSEAAFASERVRGVAASLDIGADTIDELQAGIVAGIRKLELYVNNPRGVERPNLSMAEAPVREFADLLSSYSTDGRRTHIFVCIDEYENLTDAQQALVNTYIKHAGQYLSYKIGCRVGGLRNKQTIDDNDPLSSPEDYAEVEVATSQYEDFALDVARTRLTLAIEKGLPATAELDEVFPSLPSQREVELLGGTRPNGPVTVLAEALESQLTPEEAEWFNALRVDQKYFVAYWAEKKDLTPIEVVRDWICHPTPWQTRFQNHRHASLFAVARGRKGTRIAKYYAGASSTLLGLSDGVIRYYLELLDEGLRKWLDSQDPATETFTVVVSPQMQTEAAIRVGERRLSKLKDFGEDGAQLKKLVLAIGKVFMELARQPKGAPEMNSFVLAGEPGEVAKVKRILAHGERQLAVRRTPSTKATSNFEAKDDEYYLHPVFCPVFVISHRRKRRKIIQASDLLNTSTQPKAAIEAMVGGADKMSNEPLPWQLEMFEDFFEGRQ